MKYEDDIFEYPASFGPIPRMPGQATDRTLPSEWSVAGASVRLSTRALRSDDAWVRHEADRGVASASFGVARHGLAASPAAAGVAGQDAPRAGAKIALLEARVQRLEALLGRILAERGHPDAEHAPPAAEGSRPDVEEVVDEPHAQWIEANRDVLSTFAGSFVAVDPTSGVVAHSADADELATQVERLPAEQRDRVVLFHASMYFR